MKYLITILALISPLSNASQCKTQFSQEQIETLQRAFDYGQERGWGWSLAAIAWRESSAGQNLIRFDPPYEFWSASYGVFHVYLKTAMVHEGCTLARCASKIANKLMTDFDYSAEQAIEVLEYWKRVKGDHNYHYIWKGYNDGYENTLRGVKYANDIAKKVLYLKECVRLEND